MRIALVSEHASPLALLGGEDAGGQNVHVAELARALGRRGVEVVVHTRRDDPALPRRVPFAPGVVVDHVDAGPPAPIPKDEMFPHMGDFAEDLVAAWEVDRPDVVHSHFWMSGVAALAAGARTGIPVLHTFHALGCEKRRQQGQLDTSPEGRIEAEAGIARTADHLVATTEAEARVLRDMGAPAARVAVIPCGVDRRRFRPGPRPATGSGRRPRILAASRLVPRKGVADLIRALAHVPKAELVVAGGLPAPMVFDEPEAARLRHIAEVEGVAHRVVFLGAVARADMPDLVRSADVVACCPWYEPFGLVAVEAMACGVPVVASRVGGLAETVVDGITGVHVSPRDPASIAAGLRQVLGDDAFRERAGRAAAARARRYDWDDIARRTLQVARAEAAARAPAAGREVG